MRWQNCELRLSRRAGTGIAELRARAAALAQQAGRKTSSTENAGPKIRELQARAAGFALADTP